MYAGIRRVENNHEKDDLALIVSGGPASTAAVFTQNRVQAAPVKLSRQHLRQSRGVAAAILVNAGNANCATRTGDRVASECCRAVAKRLLLPIAQVLPASTGVIGVELDSSLILKALPALVDGLAENKFDDVSRAIMTTDLAPKVAHAEVKLRRGTVRISGMTKGSGMIHPRMATTLGFVLTDARVPPAVLRGMVTRANDRSYNRLSVDGDTSTNDTLVLMANGASGVGLDPGTHERDSLEEGIATVMESLARQIARDGEGATRLVTIEVTGAATDRDAAQIARTIANSPLVKTAMAGADPNWGRILCAAGYAGVAFDPSKADIDLQETPVCRAGLAAPFSEAALKKKLASQECHIRFALRGKGKGTARFWTCDLTDGYIRINASYRT
ncbi:MAG TPA: bifunctional glutamate N-acetyltransferase/amino-acid acetyltransferase ArgJ [Bryobacteraceae bacterium]|nr:bifunctional glutamate N-acetyltransferase/amino-acid acetyltransferase ArgJ [Bryobacteraceae bacterium]